MQIRNFEKEDLSQVLDLCREVRQHHIDLLNGYFNKQNDTYEQEGFLSSLDGDKYLSLVAVVDNRIVGYILAERKVAPHLIHSKIVHICNFGVTKDARGNGIGKKLMDTLFDICLIEGIEEVNLGVYNKNTIAYNFYEKYGFKPLEQKMTFNISKHK